MNQSRVRGTTCFTIRNIRRVILSNDLHYPQRNLTLYPCLNAYWRRNTNQRRSEKENVCLCTMYSKLIRSVISSPFVRLIQQVISSWLTLRSFPPRDKPLPPRGNNSNCNCVCGFFHTSATGWTNQPHAPKKIHIAPALLWKT